MSSDDADRADLAGARGCDTMPQQSIDSDRSLREVLMLDNPEKTARLLEALRAAVPFDVELAPPVIKYLRSNNIVTAARETVSDVSYAGDEGGIVCHIVPPNRREALVVSLTHVRVPRPMPLAAAVLQYQKHRMKKLRKQGAA